MISLDEEGVELTWLKIGHPNEYKIISNHNCNFNFQGANLMQRLQKPK